MSTLSIVIPAWNEEEGIQAILERVLAIRPALAEAGLGEVEVIVVDDGSTDNTAVVAGAIAARHREVRLIRHERNKGYGAALKTGFAAARGEWIGFLDADGTYPPEYFPMLYREGVRRNADIVIGSRMAGAQSDMPWVRRLGNRLFAHLVSLISAQRITDSASGMRLFRRAVLERLYPLPDGLNLTPVMSTRAVHEQLRMVEFPIPYYERIGRSKLRVMRDGMRFAQSIIWTALHYNPVRLLGLIGMVALGLAAVIALGVVFLRARGVTALGPWGAFAVFAGLVLAVSGLSLVSLGISFNYFVALFHRRPVRQGLFGRPLVNFDRHFGWMGGMALLGSGVLGLSSLALGVRGWPTARLWFYYLAGASLALVGIQLVVSWVQMEVLRALQSRSEQVQAEMGGNENNVQASERSNVRTFQRSNVQTLGCHGDDHAF